MPLERHRRIANVWNWLPAFRAVAEYESIQRAASALRVSASSLSRTIKLLEEQLGTHLFLRASTGVTLTEAGQALLHGTREAMHRVDEAMPDPKRRLTLGVEGPLLSVLGALGLSRLSALAAWAVSMRDVSAAEAREGLVCGELDLVLLLERPPPAPLEVTRLLEVPWVIAGHTQSAALVSCAAGAPVPLSHLVSSLEAARLLAESLPARLVLPAPFVPQGLPVLEELPASWSAFASWRKEVVVGQTFQLERLVDALRDALAPVRVAQRQTT